MKSLSSFFTIFIVFTTITNAASLSVSEKCPKIYRKTCFNYKLVNISGICCPVCDEEKPKCEPICHLVKCAMVDYRKCLDNGSAYVPRDGVCNCCGQCQPVSDVIKSCPKVECPEKCAQLTPDDCLPNQVLVPRGECFCCDTCVFKKENDYCT